jgi:hypothetical protein
MAIESSEKILLVEGLNDKWFFEKFIQNYCPDISIAVIRIDQNSDNLRVSTPQDLGGTHNSKEAAIKKMKVQLQSLDKVMIVGAILDADYVQDGGGVVNTLERVKALFKDLKIEIAKTEEIGSGYVFQREDAMPPSGLWVMDNKQGEGQFEDWLIRVMNDNEKLNCFQEATNAIDVSKYKKFDDKQRVKANVLTWLAWQVKPDAGLLNVFKSKKSVASLFNENHPDFENLKIWLSTLFSTDSNKK